MDTPAVTPINASSTVKASRQVINDNFAALAAAVAERAGAWPIISSPEQLTTLTNASFLDLAGTNNGIVFILADDDPTNLNNWIRLNGYIAPVDGIPEGDLENAVQQALVLARSAVQPDDLGDYETVEGAQTKADAAQNQAQLYTDTQLGLRGLFSPAQVAVSTNINISNPGTVNFDGITFSADASTEQRRIFLYGQTDPIQNGPYLFNGSGSSMTRTSDADTSADMRPGVLIAIVQGSHAGEIFQLQTNAPIDLGTTPLVFDLASGDTDGFATISSVAAEIENRQDDTATTRRRYIDQGAAKTAAYTMEIWHSAVFDTTSGPVTQALPTPTAAGDEVQVYLTAGANTLTLTGTGGPFTLTLAGHGVTLLWTGTTWRETQDRKTKAALDAAYVTQTQLVNEAAARVAGDASGTLFYEALVPKVLAGRCVVPTKSDSFPPRVRPVETNRIKLVIRNIGTQSCEYAYQTGGNNTQSTPSTGWVAIPPGYEMVDWYTTQMVFVRGASYNAPIEVYTEVSL